MAYGQILGQAQDGDIESIARIINAGWVRIAKWETAGNYSWEAPDLFGGRPYQIGVVVIGGGQSGGASVYYDYRREYWSSQTGGNSGELRYAIYSIAPNASYSIEVGKGGKRAAATKSASSGNSWSTASNNDGGNSIFKGTQTLTALGGNSSTYFCIAISAKNYYVEHAPRSTYFGKPYADLSWYDNLSNVNFQMLQNSCLNPFTNEYMLYAGCSAYAGTYSLQTSYVSGKVINLSGLETGFGLGVRSATVQAGDGTEVGSGGGAGSCHLISGSDTFQTMTATSGAGADGAVYIYARGIDPDKYAV